MYRNRTHSFGLIILIVCLSLPSGPQAAEPSVRGPMSFEMFDIDGDGRITEPEFSAARAERMAARAAQGAPLRGAAGAPTFAFFDRNADGSVTIDEFAEARRARSQGRPGLGRGAGPNMPTFTDFDLNGDGAISKEELYEARAQRIAERSQQGYPMRNLPNAPTFEDIDANGDDVISPEEFDAHQIQHRRQMMQR